MNFKKQNTKIDDSLLLIGRNPVTEAIVSGKEIEKIFFNAQLRGEFEKEIRQLGKTYEIPIVKVPQEKLNQLCNNKNHQGIVAFMSPITYASLHDVLTHAFDQGENPLIVILESVSDVRNLAAIARTAYVMGAHALVLTLKNSARINEDAVKVSAGAILNLPICREKNMIEIINTLKLHGLTLYVTDLKSSKSITQVDFTGPCALVLGDEGQGVTYETIKASDQSIVIPQHSDFDSLNVSVAAGMLLYEVKRQRDIISTTPHIKD